MCYGGNCQQASGCRTRREPLSRLQAERTRLQEATSAAEADVSAKLADISRTEAAMRKSDREIERKTRALDAMNRRMQRIVEAAPDEESLGEDTTAVGLREWLFRLQPCVRRMKLTSLH